PRLLRCLGIVERGTRAAAGSGRSACGGHDRLQLRRRGKHRDPRWHRLHLGDGLPSVPAPGTLPRPGAGKRTSLARPPDRCPHRGACLMDFKDTAAEAAFRNEVRAWLDANAQRRQHAEEKFGAGLSPQEYLAAAKAWQARKADAGYAAI